jgi:hypothetical protein
MRVVHSEKTPWKPVRGLRGGTIEFKTLLEGEEGRPDNYQLLLANTDLNFQSPRHRHNFDQLRYSLAGSTNYGPRQNLEEGDLAYFPEGTYYGPQKQEEVGASSLSMVIQFGGPSGNGYMSLRQPFEGFDKLQAEGNFENGVFKRNSPGHDGRLNHDAYEAVWEFHNKRPVAYPKPRFMDPVHVREANFEWQPLPGQSGVATKHLGTFTEKGVGVHFVRIESGAIYSLPAARQTQLVFVKEGTGRFGSGDEWFRHTAVHVSAGEATDMRAATLTEAMLLLLPRV